MIGESLGPYRILEPLGAGGMGEVYLAEDKRLGRKVAIKVLPPAFAADGERLARFEQEARAAAALNHPHIAVVHDVGSEIDDTGAATHFMVQEYLEGRPLAERLARGALPLDKVLQHAIEVGEALVAAHRAGIVHRDLKPGNVFITRDGHAKVLDFGLAKLIDPAHPPAGATSSSPTMLGTVAGQVMGTVGYMSPEQVQGDDVDHRADLFAFGTVVYEMTTGRRAFQGTSLLDTMHAIAHSEPPLLCEMDGRVPGELERIVRKCLAKDPTRRYQSTAELVVDLRRLREDVALGAATAGAAATQPEASSAHRRRRVGGIVAAAMLVAFSSLVTWILTGPAGPLPDGALRRFVIELPDGHRLATDFRPAVAIARDGSRVAYVAIVEGGDQLLHVRAMDSVEAVAMTGTEGASAPFFSPDGNWIGFFSGGLLKKVSIEGGPALTVCEAPPNSRGATWGEDGFITFLPVFGAGLSRVAESGGDPAPFTEVAGTWEEFDHRWPQALPDGSMLFTQWPGGIYSPLEKPRIIVRPAGTDELREVVEDANYARYAASAHVVYARAQQLLALPFDLAGLAAAGPPVSLGETVLVDDNTGAAHFDIADDGTLVYVPGPTATDRALVWVDRRGESVPIGAPQRRYIGARLSPDGNRIAVTIEGTTVWVYDIEAKTLERRTFEAENAYPLWSPRGDRLVFSSNRSGGMNLYEMPSDGSGPPRALTDSALHQFPMSWSADGRYLAYIEYGEHDREDIWILPVGEAIDPFPLVQSPAGDRWARFSPDGNWSPMCPTRLASIRCSWCPSRRAFPGGSCPSTAVAIRCGRGMGGNPSKRRNPA